jgi:hypothetical protein
MQLWSVLSIYKYDGILIMQKRLCSSTNVTNCELNGKGKGMFFAAMQVAPGTHLAFAYIR